MIQSTLRLTDFGGSSRDLGCNVCVIPWIQCHISKYVNGDFRQENHIDKHFSKSPRPEELKIGLTITERQYSLDLFQQYAYSPSSICHMFYNVDETGSLLVILDPFDATNPDQVN